MHSLWELQTPVCTGGERDPTKSAVLKEWTNDVAEDIKDKSREHHRMLYSSMNHCAPGMKDVSEGAYNVPRTAMDVGLNADSTEDVKELADAVRAAIAPYGWAKRQFDVSSQVGNIRHH